MTAADQVFDQAMLLSGGIDSGQEQMLKVLCRGATGSLAARLREGLTPEDCLADFIASAALYALAALSEVGEQAPMDYIRAGDVTLRPRTRDAAANCLRNQAELMIAPYLRDRFSFLRV